MKELWQRLVRAVASWWSALKARNAEQRRHEKAVNQIVERIVDLVNPHLRAVGGYRRKLFPVADRVRAYIRELIGQLPGPVLVNRETWSGDPMVNALFGSIDRMRRVLSGPEVRRYLKQHPVGGDCYAVIAAHPDVKRQLGVELVGDTLQKDVRQTAISFRDHEVGVLGDSEAAVREAVAGDALELLVSLAILDMLEQESRISEIEERLRIVRLKLKVADARTRGAAALLEDQPEPLREKTVLAERVAELEKDLAREKRGFSGLDDRLDRLVEQLTHPEEHFGLERVTVRLDRMNIVREGAEEGQGTEIELTRGRRADRPGRVLAVIRFPRSEVLDDAERLREIERHLG